jgi:flagella basal body P-ring formation protein FlgA
MIRKLILALAILTVPAVCLMGASYAFADVRIVVPARDIARGQTISDTDLTFSTVEGGALMSGTVTNIEVLKGMEARRLLHAGETLRADDVRRPVMVSKGQTVTMTFAAPGVELTAMGRAMSEGGIGDTVTVQNPVSFRMIAGVITGAGTVRAAGPMAPIVASNANRLNSR